MLDPFRAKCRAQGRQRGFTIQGFHATRVCSLVYIILSVYRVNYNLTYENPAVVARNRDALSEARHGRKSRSILTRKGSRELSSSEFRAGKYFAFHGYRVAGPKILRSTSPGLRREARLTRGFECLTLSGLNAVRRVGSVALQFKASTPHVCSRIFTSSQPCRGDTTQPGALAPGCDRKPFIAPTTI